MEKIWLKNYPKGIPENIHVEFSSLRDAIEHSFNKYSDLKAYTCMGVSLTYKQVDQLSAQFASYLQNHTNLKKGDAIALQMPNILQFPIALFGALRAGLKVVNTNPLYTQREMAHQFKDSEAKAIVIVSNFASKLEDVIKDTKIETVIITDLGDLLGFPKSMIVNNVVKYVKKMVPKYSLPKALKFNECLKKGALQPFQAVAIDKKDIAFLQYTGGTTGLSKGAMLTHENALANMTQIISWMKSSLKEREEVVITPLPLYHIFSLTVNCLSMMYYGAESILITNPRDIKGFLATLKNSRLTVFTGLNTLFNAMMNHEDFSSVDWSSLKVSVAGGMAMQTSVSKRWEELTGCRISEGYGLTESSPVICVNPLGMAGHYGSIGLPVPSTDVKICTDEGEEVPIGQEGELFAKGPQVMLGYWKQPEETSKVLTPDGWLKTGDMAVCDSDGFFKIVDRKKDMILVSGFNVYPNEVEDVVAHMNGVSEVAAIGVPHDKSGEAVKIFVVKNDDDISVEQIIKHCKTNLAGYKVPKQIEFRDELPKTNVGKILRRELRDSEKSSPKQKAL